MSDTSGSCLFLFLPLEIRQQIYGYLLSTKWTKETVLHKAPKIGRRSPEFAPRNQHRPGHMYRFETAILRTNCQINKEAEHVFHTWNQFVSISHSYNLAPPFSHFPKLFKREGIKDIFDRRGFPILAIDQAAREFKHYAMDVFSGLLVNAANTVSTETWWNSEVRNEWRKGGQFMIACDDLKQLCRVILEVHDCLYGATITSQDHAIILVDVVTRGDQERNCLEDGSIPFNEKVRRLLEPFRSLHSISKVIIAGQMNEDYKSEIVASMMKEPPTAKDMINTACATKAEGDEAFRNKDFSSSLSEYEKAYEYIEAGHQHSFHFALVAEGKYAGSRVASAKQHLLFTLHLDIIAALLQLREYGNAYNWGKMELRTHETTISNPECARLWHLRSQASRGLGESEAAYHELVRAVLLHPDDKDLAADLGNVTANVLNSSAATLRWASSPRVYPTNRRGGAEEV